jgi:diaminohydroxyphosphoribosylaminopyrimidine deaminase/5-amino-6-(5-phosphoribosylamino)uracil reductase
MLEKDQLYMLRCLELAQKGAGMVAPNPMVGAVLVYQDRIIGEGYHEKYGDAHAEVNCFQNVTIQDQHLIPEATMYVSLEPCDHFGKTPPCSELIIQKKVKKVVVGCQDPFDQVNGKGMDRLKWAGIEVKSGVMEKECREINKRFFTYHNQRRPYIILKWAQTSDGFMAGTSNKRFMISNDQTNMLVHKWRSEEAGILVGTNTALLDDPRLNNRFWNGAQPIRMVVDNNLILPHTLHLFDGELKTIIFNSQKQEVDENLIYKKINTGDKSLKDILQISYEMGIQSILVEGGANILGSFLKQGLWDEVRLITNTALNITDGLKSPVFYDNVPITTQILGTDLIQYFRHNK